jgi:hypothetical protein
MGRRDKEYNFTVIKEKIHQEEITIINLYATNFIKHTLMDLNSHKTPTQW